MNVALGMPVSGGTATMTEAYDRLGNVTYEDRSFPGLSGDPGTNRQAFAYDNLSRVTAATGLATGDQAYSYDLDSNRISKTDLAGAYGAAYDRTDALVSVSKDGGPAIAAAYDAHGNLTSDPEAGTLAGLVAYGFDAADRTTSITPASPADPTTLALDALGRVWTRTTGPSVDTYAYTGLTDSVTRVVNTGGTGITVDSILDPAGDRLGTRTGAAVGWLLPDLHGSVAGSLDLGAATLVDALRYDAYGQTVAHWTAGGVTPNATWKYQGRLDLSPTTTSLYDFAAREYSPGLGAFTGVDTVTGSAQNPRQLNRYLYAAADPATLVDPDGHGEPVTDVLQWGGTAVVTVGAAATAPEWVTVALVGGGTIVTLGWIATLVPSGTATPHVSKFPSAPSIAAPLAAMPRPDPVTRDSAWKDLLPGPAAVGTIRPPHGNQWRPADPFELARRRIIDLNIARQGVTPETMNQIPTSDPGKGGGRILRRIIIAMSGAGVLTMIMSGRDHTGEAPDLPRPHAGGHPVAQ